jgi:membrane protein DedA with SNARE-associated domain
MFSHLALFDTQPALALSIFLLTFAYEDGATLLAVTLGMAGRLDPRLGFASAFVGIWAGDMGLYMLGAKVGAKVTHSRWMNRFLSPDSLAKAQSWFERRGTLAIILSRFIPGSRLPLYFAAGTLKQPARMFGAVTGVCAIVWVGGIFAASRFSIIPLGSGKSFAAIAVVLLIGPWLSVRLLRSALPTLRSTWRKHRRWEFWPAWMFYPPVAAMCVWLAVKYRGLALPALANPSFRNGGIIGESKIDSLNALINVAREFVADGYLLPSASFSDRVRLFHGLCHQYDMRYPVVLKPNVGQRGAGFKVIKSDSDLENYLSHVPSDLILQRYIPGEKEIGIFYYRFPGARQGEIFAITEKLFPVLIGDGKRTLEELIALDDRASLIAKTYLDRFSDIRNQVLPENQVLRLVEAGNHCQGCVFRDGRHLLSEALRDRIDQISRALTGFFIGRYDIRYSNEHDLMQGENFKIIELNGAASEATNIYDERNSLFAAYRTLYRQWALVFAIGRANRDLGQRSPRIWGIWKDWNSYRSMSTAYPAAD